MGRITPEKGFDVLIQAFEKLNTDYKLVIVGGVEAESDYEENLKKLIKSNRVVFTGYIFGEKLNEVYSHAGMYVLSSYNEGFPLVLLEAMSYQLDVLVSDIPATHLIDLKESDYFKPGDVHDLACHLQQKLATPQKRTYNLSAFDWNKIAEKWQKYTEAVCHLGNMKIALLEQQFSVISPFSLAYQIHLT